MYTSCSLIFKTSYENHLILNSTKLRFYISIIDITSFRVLLDKILVSSLDDACCNTKVSTYYLQVSVFHHNLNIILYTFIFLYIQFEYISRLTSILYYNRSHIHLFVCSSVCLFNCLKPRKNVEQKDCIKRDSNSPRSAWQTTAPIIHFPCFHIIALTLTYFLFFISTLNCQSRRNPKSCLAQKKYLVRILSLT